MSSAFVELELLEAGSCTHPEHVVHRNWRFSKLRFPATFALLRHPEEGAVLYDTGYTSRFADVTRSFPARFYRWVTPVTIAPEDTAAAQLRARGIDPLDVRTVIVSHFHADHVGGLGDFPNARFVFLAEAWAGVRNLRGINAVRNGFLPGLVPPDFEKRGAPITTSPVPLPPELRPFERGYDLFGDGSVLGVSLPGHAPGQMGLVIRRPEAAPLFLVADACWTSRCYRERIRPHPVTRLLFDDFQSYVSILNDISNLSEREPEVLLVPSHCGQIAKSPLLRMEARQAGA